MPVRISSLPGIAPDGKSSAAPGGYSMRIGVLRYSIGNLLLTGLLETVGIGGCRVHAIHMRAVSGGRAGSTRPRPDPTLANKVGATWIAARHGPQDARHTEGGPIPMGRYWLLHPREHRLIGGQYHPTWIPIRPRHHLAFGRGPFFIHGPGPHGSDGCIVVSRDDLDLLRSIVEVAAISGDGVTACELEVTA